VVWAGSWVACDLVSEMQMMLEQTVRAGDHSGVASIDESDRDGRALPVLHLCAAPPLDRLRSKTQGWNWQVKVHLSPTT
ncbi:MAG: hypothetical protein L0L93_01155, partial [Brevibacterium sp.]|nr:hypothetical protein [Brevibacterium sp.]